MAYWFRYATLGKDIYITEFSPTSVDQEITGSHVKGKWDEAAQADYAVKFYTVCFAHPAVAGITWWDLCDEGSWLEGGGLLRKDLSPKPSFFALKKLICEQWITQLVVRQTMKANSPTVASMADIWQKSPIMERSLNRNSTSNKITTKRSTSP